ncbi:MAG TPA: c-type cytochrome [Polyangia bacterium]|jgi:mono/diheme cytochrome c family protein
MLARITQRKTSSSPLGGAFIACALLALGCAATQLGATLGELAQARNQADRGATVFAGECAKCHGQRGEGIGGVSDVMGPGALPEFPRDKAASSDPALTDPQLLQIEAQARPAGAAWRDPFRNAQDLYNFTSTQMPKREKGKLKPDDYWAVVNFLLAAQGAVLPAGGVGPANASSIPIPRR